MTNTVDTVLMDIEGALQAAETVLPTVLGVVGVFSPGAKALVPFLPLLQIALQAVKDVQALVDGNTAAAVHAVTQTLQTASTTAAVVPAPGTNG